MARVLQLEQQDTVNKVRTRTGDPGDYDSSDDSSDNEDTGETSGKDLASERRERKSKVEKRAYQMAKMDISTKPDRKIRSLKRCIEVQEKKMGVQADAKQKLLQKCLVVAIQKQTYDDTQTDTIYYPKVRLIKNNERLYDPDLVSKLQRKIFIPGCSNKYDGLTGGNLRQFLGQFDVLDSSYRLEGEYNQLVSFGLTEKAREKLGMIDVTKISTGDFMSRLYLVFNTRPLTVKAIQKELTNYDRGSKTIVEVYTEINLTLSHLPQEKSDLGSEMLFDAMESSIPPELRDTIRKLLKIGQNGKRE